MKKIISIAFVLLFVTINVFAAGYDEIFEPLIKIQNVLKYLGTIVLVISLIGQGVITFFGDNIPEIVKKTLGKVLTGGCLIGGASAIAGFILPNTN